MEQISFYLKKFQNLKIKDEALKKLIIETIKQKTNVVLEKKDILVLKNGLIKIIKTGPQKTQIFLNKKTIEEDFNKKII